jgi:hypothetical protein
MFMRNVIALQASLAHCMSDDVDYDDDDNNLNYKLRLNIAHAKVKN